MPIFLAILISGLLFFLLTLFFGGEHGDLGHADMGHGDFGHGGFGGHHDGGHVGGHHADNQRQPGPSIFSIRSFFLFMTGFGAAGALALSFGYSMFGSSLWGVFSGLVFAIIGWWFFKIVFAQQASTTVDTSTLVGNAARVTVRIESGCNGEVVTNDQFGHTRHLLAHAADGSSFGEGTVVAITAAAGNQVTVK